MVGGAGGEENLEDFREVAEVEGVVALGRRGEQLAGELEEEVHGADDDGLREVVDRLRKGLYRGGGPRDGDVGRVSRRPLARLGSPPLIRTLNPPN